MRQPWELPGPSGEVGSAAGGRSPSRSRRLRCWSFRSPPRRQDLYAVPLRTTYRQAQISPLEMLLASGSITQFTDRVQAMVLINRQDQQLVSEIRSLRASTAAKEASWSQETPG